MYIDKKLPLFMGRSPPSVLNWQAKQNGYSSPLSKCQIDASLASIKP